MKKYVVLLLALFFMIVLTSCSSYTNSSRTLPSEHFEPEIDQAPSQTIENTSPSSSTSEYVAKEEIKATVLAHANLKEDDIKFYNIHLDYDDDFKRYEYDISFSADKYEYDYEVNALTGEIINFDKEHISD